MSAKDYQDLLARAEQLQPDEQVRLLADITAMLRRRTAAPRTSIMELRGLGKEVWGGVDAQEYVNRERASWNG
ncbi:MAG: hypothetical protein FJ291_14650 [Planctomycetes bacterium]|nr:hypothetical protein [Planctomycetota bacterium]